MPQVIYLLEQYQQGYDGPPCSPSPMTDSSEKPIDSFVRFCAADELLTLEIIPADIYWNHKAKI